MSRPLYVGVNNIAKSSDNVYYGVDDKARKVKRMYYGDEHGIAQLCFAIDEEIGDTPKTVVYDDGLLYDEVAAVKFNNKAVYIGGKDSSGNITDRIMAIDETLTATIVGHLPEGIYGAGAESINDEYIIIFGGIHDGSNNASDMVYVYDKDFTLVSSKSSGGVSSYLPYSGSTSEYVLFKYGFTSSTKGARTLGAIKVDKNLTISIASMSGEGGKAFVGVSSGNDRIMYVAGETTTGSDSGLSYALSDAVEYYDENCTYTQLDSLNYTIRNTSGAYVNGNYLFAGGVTTANSNTKPASVDYVRGIIHFDSDMTQNFTTVNMSEAKITCAGETEDHVVFAGGVYHGTDGTYYCTSKVEIVDKDLTVSTIDTGNAFDQKWSKGIAVPGKLIFNFVSDKGYEIFDI